MKTMIVACLAVSAVVLSAVATEDPAPNSILIRTYSLHGCTFAYGGMHATRELQVKTGLDAQLDIIPRGKSGVWIAEARSLQDKVKITIQVYDDKGKLIASAEAEGKKIVGSIANDKPTATCLDDRKD